MSARYKQLLSDGQQSIARAIGLLASESSLPAVFHCSAGKDRTGVLAAIVLGCLGVPDEVIIDDYALSAIGTARLMQSLREEYADAVEEVEKYATAILRVIPEAMAGFIEHVRADKGGFDALARARCHRRGSCSQGLGGDARLTRERRPLRSAQPSERSRLRSRTRCLAAMCRPVAPVLAEHSPALVVAPVPCHVQVSRGESLEPESEPLNEGSRRAVAGLDVRLEPVQPELAEPVIDREPHGLGHAASSGRALEPVVAERRRPQRAEHDVVQVHHPDELARTLISRAMKPR